MEFPTGIGQLYSRERLGCWIALGSPVAVPDLVSHAATGAIAG
jgi:hypothetical protein